MEGADPRALDDMCGFLRPCGLGSQPFGAIFLVMECLWKTLGQRRKWPYLRGEDLENWLRQFLGERF